MHRAADPISALSIAKAAAPLHRAELKSGAMGSWQAMIILLLLTLLGGFLRFYHLTLPVLWNDEALVYWRVCGTYAQMLEPLRNDMFPPLHYSLYWAIGHLPLPEPPRVIWSLYLMTALLCGVCAICVVIAARRKNIQSLLVLLTAGFLLAVTRGAVPIVFHYNGDLSLLFPGTWTRMLELKLTPVTMRMVPAIAGTLTIPAVYFLSRQMLARGTSLVAAAITACSAFMLFYSRDAKMYPHLWLFIALGTASLLWWFRTGILTAWLCWVASGCAACGLHFSALAMLPLSLLFLMTQRKLHWKKVLWFVAGSALIGAGPLGYFTKFNPVAERLQDTGWSATGIGWVGAFFNGNRTGPQYPEYTASSFMAGYEWPRDDYIGDDSQDTQQPIWNPLLEVPQAMVTEIFCILAIAALPWPMFLRRARDPLAEPQWRVFLWLGGWILFIGYGFYCHSVRGFVSPRRWDYELMQWLPPWAVPLGVGIAATFIAITATHRCYRPALVRFVQLLMVIAALYGGCLGIFNAMNSASINADLNNTPWGSIWEPRYLGFIWPAVGVAAAALLMRLPTRPVRIACVFIVLAINLAMFAMRITLDTEPPIDRLAKDLWDSQDPRSVTRTFHFIQYGDIAVAGSAMVRNTHVASGRYYLQMDSDRQPISPAIFASSLDTYNLRSNTSYSAVKHAVDTAPQLKHLVFWSQIFPRQPVTSDPYRKVLPGWRMASEDVYTIRISWDWRERWKWIRREYVRR